MVLTPLDYIRQSVSLHLEGAQLSSSPETELAVQNFLACKSVTEDGGVGCARLFAYISKEAALEGSLEVIASAVGPPIGNVGSILIVNAAAPEAVTLSRQLHVMVLTPPNLESLSGSPAVEEEAGKDDTKEGTPTSTSDEVLSKSAAADSLAMYARHAYAAVVHSLFDADDRMTAHVQTKIRDLELTLQQLKRRSKGGSNIPIIHLKSHVDIVNACKNISEEQSSSLSLDDLQSLSLMDDSWLNDVQNTVNTWIVQINKLTNLIETTPFPDTSIESNADFEEIQFWTNLESTLQNLQNVELNRLEVRATIMVLKNAKRFLATISLENTNLDSALGHVQDIVSFLKPLPLERIVTSQTFSRLSDSVEMIYVHLPKIRFSKNYNLLRLAKLLGAISLTFTSKLSDIIKEKIGNLNITYGVFVGVHEEISAVVETWDKGWQKFVEFFTDLCRKRKLARTPSSVVEGIDLSSYETLKKRIAEVHNFRQNHELLRQHVTQSHPKLVPEVENAITAFTGISVFDTSSSEWTNSCESYDSRIHTIETKLASVLSSKLAGCRDAEEMFVVFKQFTNLLSREPIRQSVKQYQVTLMENTTIALNTLQDKFTDRTSGAKPKMEVAHVPPVTARLLWAKLMEREVNRLQENLAALLGPDWARDIHGSKLATRCQELLSKLDARGYFRQWVSNQEKMLTGSLVRRSYVIDIKKDIVGYYAIINYSREMANLHAEIDMLVKLGFQVPRTLSHFAQETRQQYPYASAARTALRTYATIMRQLDSASATLVEPQLVAIADQIKLAFGNRRVKWDSKSLVKWISELVSYVEALESRVYNLLLLRCQLDDRLHALSLANLGDDLSVHTLAIQKIVDDLSLAGYSNLKEYCESLDRRMEKVLVIKLEKALDDFVVGCYSGKKTSIIKVSLVMKGGRIVVDPSIASVREQFVKILHEYIETITGLDRVHSSRFELFNDSSITIKKFDNLLRLVQPGKVVTCYKYIQGVIDDSVAFAEKWLQYQTLWDATLEELSAYLSGDFDKWRETIKEFRETRVLLDCGSEDVAFGPISVSYFQIQSQVSLKYDAWWQDILRLYTNFLGDQIQSHLDELSETKESLEKIHLHPATNTTDLLRGVTFLRKTNEKISSWKQISIDLSDGEKLARKFNRKMPQQWREASTVAGTLSLLNQALLKRQQYVQENVSVLQGRVKQAGDELEQKVDQSLESWGQEKPLSGKIPPTDALTTLNTYKNLFMGLRNEIDDLDQALIVLEISSVSLKGSLLDSAIEELDSLNEVWSLINGPSTTLSSLKSAAFSSCNLRKLRGDLDRLLQECRALPSRVRQYDGYNAVRDSISDTIGAYGLLSELQNPAVQFRHWTDILKVLNITSFNYEKVTVGELLDNGIVSKKGSIQAIVARAQGEMALESFLEEIKSSWSESFHLVLYQNRVRLIKDWDELYTQIDDHLTQLALMPGSLYYSTSPTIPQMTSTWTSNLTSLRVVFDNLIDMQRRWVYLESIFGAGSGSDVRSSLPAEWSKFQKVDKEFIGLMRKVSGKNSMIEVLGIEGMVKSLERMVGTCTTIQKHLNQYLQTQRQQFCRFYFTGDDDLLDIIGGGSGIGKVAGHLGKMFAGVVGVEGNDLTGPAAEIDGIVSKEGEIVKLSKPITLNENVISWLNKLEKGMQESLANLLYSALDSESSEGSSNVVMWSEKYPAQIVILAMLVQWSMAIDQALSINLSGETKSDPIDELKVVLASLETKLAIMAKSVLEGAVAPTTRKKYEQVITELVHQRDVTRSLIKDGVSSNFDFSWLYHLRFCYDKSMVGENQLKALNIRLSHAKFDYGYEYQGMSERLVQTPLTDRCYLTLTQALHFRLGGSPFGPAGTGKTESVKALGATMGKFVVVMNCDETFDFGAMGRLFCGLCQVGAWGCFDEFNRLEERILSAVSSQILTIQQGLLRRQNNIELLGKQISLHPGVGVFVTMNPGYAGRSNLPDNLKSLFRSVAMVIPDRKLIAQVMLFSQGIVSAEVLSGKVVDLFSKCEKRMSKQKHYDFGLRALKTLLVSAGALKRSALESFDDDESLMEQDLLQKIEKDVLIKGASQNVVPKLISDDLPIFNEILGDIFPGAQVVEMENGGIIDILQEACKIRHFVPGYKWVQKVLQLKQVMEMRHGVMLVGPVGSGKSSALSILRTVLEKSDDVKGDMYVIDAKAMDKDALYGVLDGTTMEWTDGVFTNILRKIIEGARGEKDRFHWIVFDGDVDPEWAENLNSVLDDNKLLTLPSGERINIPPNIRIVIEVDSLEQATPATVSRCGMVWFSDDTLTDQMCLQRLYAELSEKDVNGGQVVSEAQTDFAHNVKELLVSEKSGRKSVVNEALSFALHHNHIMTISREQLLTPFVSLLHKGVENVIDYNETHLDFPMSGEHLEKFSQRWVLFSLCWSFTGSAGWEARRQFGDKLCNLVGIELPEPGSNLVDYRVRPIDGEFENWSQSVPRSEIESHQVTATDVVVTTTDTVRHTEILSSWLNSRMPLILCGPPGSGKTLSLTSVLQSMQNITLASLNFSSGTTPEIILKTFSQYCSYYRRGKSIVLEPMESFGTNNWLVVFCDEINLPSKDIYGTQRVIMFMRQLVEQGGFWREEDNVWVKINRIQFVGACNPPSDAGREKMSPRFLRHAPILLVDFPSQESMRQIYGTFNGGIFKLFPNLKGEKDAMTEAMVELYTENQSRFTTEMQPQYFYSPRELSRWVRGIYEAVNEMESLTKEELVRIWAHEALRLFSDRLVEEDEREWCEGKIDECARKRFAGVDFEVALKRPMYYSSWLTKETRGIQHGDLKTFLAARLRVFYEEELDVPLVVFDEVLDHVLRIDRVLRQPMGHCLLVGDAGVGKTVLSKFVSWMNGLSIFQIKAHSRYSLHDFNEDLRSVMKRVGVEGEKVCFIFDEANALESGFLEAMNALLASGEVPGLFEGDDYTLLMTACRDAASREGLIIDQEEELWRRFTSMVQTNLHVVFTMNPSGGDWKNRSTASPALFNRCVVDWFGTWNAKAKGQVGKEFTSRLDYGDAESVGGAFGIGPGEVLMDCVQSAFGDDVTNGSFRQAVVAALVEIHEATKRIADASGTFERRTYLCPRDYIAFIEAFVAVVNERRSLIEDEQLHINAGLTKLRQTHENVEELKVGLGQKTVSLREKESLANAKLQQMVGDQNIAEKQKQIAEDMGRKVEKQQAEIDLRKAEAQRDLDQAEPALIEAQNSVKSIKKRDLDEVRNLARPPKNVQLTLECIAIMLKSKTEWGEIRKILSKSDFIPSIINFDANTLSQKQIEIVQKKYMDGNDGLSVESVTRSSKACGPLYKWAESQIKFSAVYNRVQPLREEVEKLEEQAFGAKTEKERIDNEVNDLEEKISQYKSDYATLIRDVEILKDEMDTVKTKVSRAESLLQSLGHESQRWEKSSSNFSNILQCVIGDGLLLGAFLTYTGYFDFKTRGILLNTWRDILDSIGILYRDQLSMVESLSKASDRLEWEVLGLPADSLSMENGVILSRCKRYPLVIDPSGAAISFLLNTHKEKKIQKTSFLDKAFMKTLASAVRFGTTLLVENVENIDPVLNPLLNKEIQRTGGRHLVRIGSEDVDYNPSFNIILSTKNPATRLTPDICSRVTLVNFTVTPASLQSQSLSMILQKEKPDVEKQRVDILKLQGEQNVKLRHLEDQMLTKISAVEGSILDDDKVVEGMEVLMKEGTLVEQQIAKSTTVMSQVQEAISKLSSLSLICRKIFVLLSSMRKINYLYEFSAESFMSVLHYVLDTNKADGDSDDLRLSMLKETLVRETVARMGRGLLAEDKITFVLLLAKILNENEVGTFDDDTNVEDLIEKIATIFGNDFNWQGRGLDQLKRVTQHEITASVPMLLCSAPGHDVSERLESMAKSFNIEMTSVAMGSTEGFDTAAKMIATGSKLGTWVLLKNCHLCTEWLGELVKKIQSMTPHKGFRLFITSEISPKLPTGLLRMSDVIVAEAQKGIKATISRFFTNIPSDRLKVPEKNRLYLLLGWLHSVIQERLRFVPMGWSESYGFTESDANHALDSIDALFDGSSGGKQHLPPEQIPWEAIRTTMSKSIFGGRIAKDVDQEALDKLLNRLLNADCFEVDFKLVEVPNGPILPEHTSMENCLQWIASLPTYNPPTWIGLDNSAETQRSKLLAKRALEKMALVVEGVKDDTF